jgi:transposase
MPTDIATRASVLTLLSMGKTNAEVSSLLTVPKSTIRDILSRAIQRGFDPNVRPLEICDAYLTDAPRSGRPKKQTPETQDKILAKVRLDRYGREKTCADLAGELSSEGIDVSAMTVWRILKSAGMKKTKPTRKPGLTQKMKKERLEWCLAHEHWTLEDFKNVIWTDETSVVLLHRRGGYRIWRLKDEALVRSCIRERWKGSSEFIFWGSFSYDRKGPCYCWRPETAQEKREADIQIARLNEELEPIMKEKWELENGIRRLNLRQLPGLKPTWR